MNATMLQLEIRRIVRDPVTLFFTVGLPVFFYLIFGADQPYSEESAGNGNVAMSIMVAMAAYGAVSATVGIGGRAALEKRQGWGRQLGLTPLRDSAYVAVKSVLAVVFASVTVALVFLAGGLTTAAATPLAWMLSFGLLVVGAAVFALYGLCFGLAFGSEAALSAAGGSVVILGFLGNIFIPLSGTLLAVAKWTPLYGYAALARFPISEGTILVGGSGETVVEPLWIPLANVAGWLVVLALLAGWLVRRGRVRP